MLWVVQWIIIPLILLIILLYGIMLPIIASETEAKVSGFAGIFAGLVVFIFFLLSQQDSKLEFSSELSSFSFQFFPSLGGFILGIVTKFVIDLIFHTRALGIVTLIIVATILIAIFTLIFVKDLRSTIMFLSLGTLLGGLMYLILAPESLGRR